MRPPRDEAENRKKNKARELKKRASASKKTNQPASSSVLSKKIPGSNTLEHPASREKKNGNNFPIVGIGASAGGLKALTALFQNLPHDTGMGFVVVQHLSPKHESLMAAILSRATKMKVSEIKDGMPVEPNHVYVMSEKACISLSEGKLKVQAGIQDGGAKMPIDYFLQSLAADWRNKSIAVILSGSASDGSRGLGEIKEAGGITFAQDEASAEYESMPHSAVSTGYVDFICSPKEIAAKLVVISRHPYTRNVENESEELILPGDDDFRQILKILQQASGIHFSHYKTPTIRRRVVRRMVLNKSESLKDYLLLLKKNNRESQLLVEDVLIHVTHFFRDPEMFESLKKEVFPRLLKNREPGAPIRVWVSACSTGEEAYSIAIALFEYLGGRSNEFPVQVFATDVKESCIQTARKGIYAKGPSFGVSEQRLQRFFTKVGKNYQIVKSVRDACVFAKQNVLADPPYSKIDLVSCRNLLIYLNAEGQKKTLTTFHYALKPSGVLVLGKSESVGDFSNLFEPIGKKIKIYSKKTADPKNVFSFTPNTAVSSKVQELRPKVSEPKTLEVFKEADRAIIMKYEHAGVVINEKMEILQFRGDTSPFLNNSPGAPSNNLFKMARDGLGAALHESLAKVKQTGLPVQKKGIRIKVHEQLREVLIETLPLKSSTGLNHFLILFSLVSPKSDLLPRSDRSVQKSKSGKYELSSHEQRIQELETELSATKTYLRSIIEEKEAANLKLQSVNEDSQASNEEFQSMNEELQSTNEELETAQEELQVTNEEITTMNDELQNRISQLTVLNDDLENLLTSIHLPVVIVGKDMCIRRFTRAAGKVLHLKIADIGRPLMDLKPRINFPDMEAVILEVMKSASVEEREVQDELGTWYIIQIRGYKTSGDKIEGAVIMMTDINDLKRNQELLEIHQARLEISNEELEQFAYVASHDLQEPLRVISMYLDLLKNRYKDKLDKDAEGFITVAKQSAERSEKMIRDLLSYARIGINPKTPQKTDFEAVLKRTLTDYEIPILECGAEITHDPLPVFLADRFQMLQLFHNLLSNALKYCGEKPLKIHISAKEQDNDWLFTFKDNGIGIDRQYKDKVFALFQRIQTDPEHVGSGIGLAVCKKIVEHHGGKIWIDSQLDKGSTFYFTLSKTPHFTGGGLSDFESHRN